MVWGYAAKKVSDGTIDKLLKLNRFYFHGMKITGTIKAPKVLANRE